MGGESGISDGSTGLRNGLIRCNVKMKVKGFFSLLSNVAGCELSESLVKGKAQASCY